MLCDIWWHPLEESSNKQRILISNNLSLNLPTEFENMCVLRFQRTPALLRIPFPRGCRCISFWWEEQHEDRSGGPMDTSLETDSETRLCILNWVPPFAGFSAPHLAIQRVPNSGLNRANLFTQVTHDGNCGSSSVWGEDCWYYSCSLRESCERRKEQELSQWCSPLRQVGNPLGNSSGTSGISNSLPLNSPDQ